LKIPSSDKELRSYIKTQLVCPLPIEDGDKYQMFKEELVCLWEEVCWKHSVDDEAKHIYLDNEVRDLELEEDNLFELRPIAINIATWIKDAKKEFHAATRPIQALVAGPSVYGKHYLYKSLKLKEIKKLARKNDCSYFFSNLTSEIISKMFFTSVKKNFLEVISIQNIRYAVECGYSIGVTNTGDETEFLMIEINSSSLIAHAYPCSRDEAINKVKTVVKIS